jgi:hypothetical protein
VSRIGASVRKMRREEAPSGPNRVFQSLKFCGLGSFMSRASLIAK